MKVNLTSSVYIYTYIYTYRASWRRKWQPSPVFLPGKSHGQRNLVGYSPWGRRESDTTERLHFHFHRASDTWDPILGRLSLHLVWKTSAMYSKTLKRERERDSSSEDHVHDCSLLGAKLRKHIEMAQSSDWFNLTMFPGLPCAHTLAPVALGQLPTGGKPAIAEKMHTWEGQKELIPGIASEWGEGSHCWQSWKQWIGSCPEL